MKVNGVLQKAVFAWLDTIAAGTNKKAVKALLTARGINYVFQLGLPTSKKLFEKWQTLKKTNKS